MLIITVVSGPDKGRVFRLAENDCHRVGRHRGSVALDDRSISSRHAELVRNDAGLWTVTDLGSSNGTFVNKQRLEPNDPAVIEDGDRIQFGRAMVVFNLVSESDGAAHSGAHDVASQQAALAIEQRNQQLLQDILDKLAAAPASPSGGMSIPTSVLAYDDTELRDMLQRVLDRLDRVESDFDDEPAAASAAPDLSPKLDELREALDRLADRAEASAQAAPAPAPAMDPELSSKLDQLLTSARQRGDDDITAKLDAVIELVSGQSVNALDRKLDQLAESLNAAADQPAPEAVDLSPIQQQLDSLRTALDEARTASAQPAADPALHDKLDALLTAMRDDRAAADDAADSPDRSAEVVARLDELTAALPGLLNQSAVDLTPLNARLDALSTSLAEIANAKPEAPAAPTPDAELHRKLDAVLTAIREDRAAAEAAAGDDSSDPSADIIARLDELAAALPGLLKQPAVDLTPLAEKLEAIGQSVAVKSDDELARKLDDVLAAVQREPADDADADASSAADSAVIDKLDALLTAVQVDRSAQIAAKLEAAIETFHGPRHQSIERKLDALLAAPDPAFTSEAPAAFDDAPLHEKLDAIVSRLDAASLDAVERKLDELSQSLAESSAAAAAAKPAEPVDLSPIQQAIADLAERVDRAAAARPTESSGDAAAAPASDDRRLDVLVDVAHASNQTTGELSEKLDAIIIALADQRDDDLEARLTGALSAIVEAADDSSTTEAIDALRQRLDTLIEQQAKAQSAAGDEAAAAESSAASELRPLIEQVIARLDAMAAPADNTEANARAAAARADADKLHAAVASLRDHVFELANRPMPEPVVVEPPAPDARVDDVLRRLDELAARVNTLPTELPQMPEPQPAPTVDLQPVLDAIAEQRDVQRAAAESAPAVDLQPVLDAIAQQREAQTAAAESAAASVDPRFDALLQKLEAVEARVNEAVDSVAAAQAVEPPDHRPMLRRILEVIEHEHGSPDRVPADAQQIESVLRKIHDRLNAIATPPNSERTVSDMFNLLRSLEQEQQRQADALRQLADRQRKQSAEPSRRELRDLLSNHDDDDEPAPRPSKRYTPASTMVVPHQRARDMVGSGASTGGGRSVLLTIVVYVGLTLAIVWGALSIADGRPFNPFPAPSNNNTPSTSPATGSAAPANSTPNATTATTAVAVPGPLSMRSANSGLAQPAAARLP